MFTSSLTTFNVCRDCGLPFLHKGFISHTKTCKRVPPRRVPLPPHPTPTRILSPSLPLPINMAQPLQTMIGPTPRSRLSSLPLFSSCQRELVPSPACMEGGSTPGSSAAQALQDLMTKSMDGEEKWLLNEISLFDVPVKRKAFPKEASSLLRDTLDVILSLALTLKRNSSIAFSAYSLFILFPRLLLRPLPTRCQSRFAEAAFRNRCIIF